MTLANEIYTIDGDADGRNDQTPLLRIAVALEGILTVWQNISERHPISDPVAPIAQGKPPLTLRFPKPKEPHSLSENAACPPREASLQPTMRAIAAALEQLCIDQNRIADHFAPEPESIVGTDYVAAKLGCTPIHAARLARDGDIPRSCVVPGTGDGKPWKLYRRHIDEWLAAR